MSLKLPPTWSDIPLLQENLYKTVTFTAGWKCVAPDGQVEPMDRIISPSKLIPSKQVRRTLKFKTPPPASSKTHPSPPA
jgi:hypothetical protein